MARMRASDIRRAAAGRAGRQYGQDVRAAAMQEVRRRREAGDSLRAVSRDLGISYETLRHWIKGEPGELRPVEVMGFRGGAVIVRLPGGASVEGLDLQGVAELARLLS